jgi:STE24 endopeptidase
VHPFTALFLAALALATATQLWLAWRHVRHVSARREAVPAEFAGRISPEAHRKAADYTAAKTRLAFIEIPVGAAVALALTLGGGIEALSAAWGRVAEPGGYAHGVALIFSVALVSALVELPFSVYRTFVIEARFGFNRVTPALFAADLVKGALVAAVIGLPLVLVVLWLMARMGELWWLYVWVAWVAFALLMHAIIPTWVMPLFNKFVPLEDPQLKGRIEGLLAKCGFRSQGLYVMDGSKRSSHGNAFFTGMGKAKRIVLFDTLIQRLAPPEIEAVLAHELGHFSLRHVWKRMVLSFAVALPVLWILARLMQTDWFYPALGVETPGTAAALLLFFIALPSFTFLLQPLASLYSRRHEYEADAYAASHAPASDLVHALVKLYEDNAATLTPDPLHSAFYDSHPPALARIERLQATA